MPSTSKTTNLNSVQFKAQGSDPATPSAGYVQVYEKGKAMFYLREDGVVVGPLGPIDPATNGGRLTLTSGTPVTIADVTGATNVYFTPYISDQIALYDGTYWRQYTFTERTLALGTLTNGLTYDVFIYDNAGTLTLELLAWTNTTTRATALVRQNGVLCRTGSLGHRYLGTFYTASTTTTQDAASGRYMVNVQNTVPLVTFDQGLTDISSTSDTYASIITRNVLVAVGQASLDCMSIFQMNFVNQDPRIRIALDAATFSYENNAGGTFPSAEFVQRYVFDNVGVGLHSVTLDWKRDAASGTIYCNASGTAGSGGVRKLMVAGLTR